MTVQLAKMVRFWGSRIGFVRDPIKPLGEKGFNATDEDGQVLYKGLGYSEECRRCAIKELAWEDV